MSEPRIRRAAPVIVLIAALAIVGASCTPANAPPQPQHTLRIKANTLHVLDDNNDCFGPCEFDEPYLVNLDFRAWFNHPNSASTFLVDDISNELTCPGGPSGGIFGSTATSPAPRVSRPPFRMRWASTSSPTSSPSTWPTSCWAVNPRSPATSPSPTRRTRSSDPATWRASWGASPPR